ncbi:MAG: SURF1 family cytochrome oxidase biogenesis protein [Alphaproteobacteria bacterium]
MSQKKSRLRPKILLPLIIISFLLGVWQCFRLYAKQDIITVQLKNQSNPALIWQQPNDKNFSFIKKQNRGKKYIISGELFPAQTIYLLSLAPDGSESRGYLPIMPFLTSDGDWLLVAVGFYRERLKKNITSQMIDKTIGDDLAQLQKKNLTLTLYSDPIRQKGFFMPDNIANSKIWFYLDKTHLAKKWQRAEFLSPEPSNDFIFKLAQLQPENTINLSSPIEFFSEGLPLPYNRHVEYIATWWLLALFGFLLYWFGTGTANKTTKKNYHKKKLTSQKQP